MIEDRISIAQYKKQKKREPGRAVNDRTLEACVRDDRRHKPATRRFVGRARFRVSWKESARGSRRRRAFCVSSAVWANRYARRKRPWGWRTAETRCALGSKEEPRFTPRLRTLE